MGMRRRVRKRGNCYVTCEALYHLLKTPARKGLGVKLVPMTLRHEGEVHWVLGFMLPDGSKLILDPTGKQFKTKPDLRTARGRGFLTKKPSKRARALMKLLLWQS